VLVEVLLLSLNLMSKLINKLNQISQTESQPMGFKATQTSPPKPKILLIASLAQNNLDHMADYVAGADAALLHISNLSSGIETIQKMRRLTSAIPWGAWLKGVDQEGIKRIAKIECDFLVFPAAGTSLTIPQNNKVGRILEVEPALSEGLLRAVNALPVDAVLIANEEGGNFLTWHDLMFFQRFADFLTKPLIVCVPSSVAIDEFQALWGAGVDGVVTEVGGDQPVGRLKELRQAIDKLVFPPQYKRGKRGVLLPYVGRVGESTNEEEEEE